MKSKRTFHLTQRRYVAPAINLYWQSYRQTLIDVLGEKEILVGGDDGSDSPGHSRQYCTYSLLDSSTNIILEQEVVDVRQADGKSVKMEKIGYRIALRLLLDDHMHVSVIDIVTDMHPKIIK